MLCAHFNPNRFLFSQKPQKVLLMLEQSDRAGRPFSKLEVQMALNDTQSSESVGVHTFVCLTAE